MPSPVEYLKSAQHETGGWGYKTGHKPVIEATTTVLLAIRDIPEAKSNFQAGLAWVMGCQNPDGGWGINAEDKESGWHTAWALLALKYANQTGEPLSKAVEWLSYVTTYKISEDELKSGQIPAGKSSSDLVWPWLPELAGWIEPTASAVLALEGLALPEIANLRINAAFDYFKQYRTPIGGWDMGNAGEYDSVILPRGYPTALVLLALARSAPDKILDEDITALQHAMNEDPSLLVQASGLLAFSVLGKKDESAQSALMQEQAPDGSWDSNPFFTAWAMMAVRGYL
jgi:Prenyltransferase and squalene oxidase repeat